MAKLTSGDVRWIQAPTGAWHAYSYNWEPGEHRPERNRPACGASHPRTRLGRDNPPPPGEEMCRVCVHLVGFHRRPRGTARLLKKYRQAEGMGVDARLCALEGAAATLSARVAALEASHAGLGNSLTAPGSPELAEGWRPTRTVTLAELREEWEEPEGVP